MCERFAQVPDQICHKGLQLPVDLIRAQAPHIVLAQNKKQTLAKFPGLQCLKPSASSITARRSGLGGGHPFEVLEA